MERQDPNRWYEATNRSRRTGVDLLAIKITLFTGYVNTTHGRTNFCAGLAANRFISLSALNDKFAVRTTIMNTANINVLHIRLDRLGRLFGLACYPAHGRTNF